RSGVEVEIAESHERAARARAIAAEAEWAARLSFAARWFAETTLDLRPVADAVLELLDLTRPAGRSSRLDPQDRVQQRLAELATPGAAPIRRRAMAATACFGPSVHRS
ncbi:MAG: hypothetical protein M3Z46_06140, partial [Actinomycetota bacterium]|nr:hypothetical protein [Actinomycetota bacterium]